MIELNVLVDIAGKFSQIPSSSHLPRLQKHAQVFLKYTLPTPLTLSDVSTAHLISSDGAGAMQQPAERNHH